MNKEQIEDTICRLLFQWFPFLEKIVDNGGIIFGGVLREMWYAASTYKDNSQSLDRYISHHMNAYFKAGGDVDFMTTNHIFSSASGIDLIDIDFYDIAESFKQIETIIEVETRYELNKIVNKINKNELEDHREYGDSSDKYTKKLLDDVFPSQHFLLSVTTTIIPDDTIEVSMDMISFNSIKKMNELDEIGNCDFCCNLLMIKKNDSKPTIMLRMNSSNCKSINNFDKQISSKKLRFFPNQKRLKPTRFLFRLSKRIENGWTIDCKDKVTMKLFVEYLVLSMDDYDIDVYLPKSQKKENELYHQFFREKGTYILEFFRLAEKHMKLYLNNHSSSNHYSNRISTKSILTFIQDLYVRHGKYFEFKKWSSDIADWSIEEYNSENLCKTVQYQSQLISKMFNECKFRTNKDAIDFLVSLIKYDRKAEFMTYLKMNSFKQTISCFNKLSDDDKLMCPLFREFFCKEYSDNSDDIHLKVEYLQLLINNGLKLPIYKRTNYNVRRIYCQSTDLIKILWDNGVISKDSLFPKTDNESLYVFDDRPILATLSNLKWLLEINIDLTENDLKQMLSNTLNISFDFLFEYKKYCNRMGFKFELLEKIFTEGFRNNNWSTIENYFIYRFDTDRPNMDQICKLVVMNSHDYYSRKKYIISMRVFDYHYVNEPFDFRRTTDRNLNVFQKLIRWYGPHMFIGTYSSIKNKISKHLNIEFSQVWFILTYWLWRISHKKNEPIIQAWYLPHDVINIIADHITTGLNNERCMITGWDSDGWATFKNNVLENALTNKKITF